MQRRPTGLKSPYERTLFQWVVIFLCDDWRVKIKEETGKLDWLGERYNENDMTLTH